MDINPRDYRAWYGLGQAYELIMMPYYALYYFRKATQLRPHDARMWCAMGQCYENEQLCRDDAAIQCYKRAVSNNDREGIALHKLAQLHERQVGRVVPRSSLGTLSRVPVMPLSSPSSPSMLPCPPPRFGLVASPPITVPHRPLSCLIGDATLSNLLLLSSPGISDVRRKGVVRQLPPLLQRNLLHCLGAHNLIPALFIPLARRVNGMQPQTISASISSA